MGFILTTTMYGVCPLYTYSFLNERPFFIPMILPFIDPNTWIGYHINASVQFFISFTGIIGAIGIEIILTIIVNNVHTAISIIEFYLCLC